MTTEYRTTVAGKLTALDAGRLISFDSDLLDEEENPIRITADLKAVEKDGLWVTLKVAQHAGETDLDGLRTYFMHGDNVVTFED